MPTVDSDGDRPAGANADTDAGVDPLHIDYPSHTRVERLVNEIGLSFLETEKKRNVAVFFSDRGEHVQPLRVGQAAFAQYTVYRGGWVGQPFQPDTRRRFHSN